MPAHTTDCPLQQAAEFQALQQRVQAQVQEWLDKVCAADAVSYV